MSQPTFKVEFDGKAKVGQVMGNLQALSLKPEDFSSPIALQMALSKLYNDLMKSLSEKPQPHYIADVRFSDSMGNPINLAVDFGNNLPPMSKQEVKVKITIEFYDEE
ncbi:hypothetical protein [Sulfuracidifex tepidarius]|uniref:Uncharacterized protein n=1 Tax=Sulfuracidifex tepidarius TaxID=1294262 RepID=A0A510E292_9CREN|nr:hypothetical protein [Sulfuracidifex tepidarius]BBG23876.1 hypothetical protein IC006_1172 [Sulfuracidifex tepidarius]BBG26631.1 hypothetical protein IC007_1147 [Sulfuracidifex tepidarius]